MSLVINNCINKKIEIYVLNCIVKIKIFFKEEINRYYLFII